MLQVAAAFDHIAANHAALTARPAPVWYGVSVGATGGGSAGAGGSGAGGAGATKGIYLREPEELLQG